MAHVHNKFPEKQLTGSKGKMGKGEKGSIREEGRGRL
jgi:hypothetical protein